MRELWAFIFGFLKPIREDVRQLRREIQAMSAATDALAVEVKRAVDELDGDGGTIATLRQNLSDAQAALAAKQAELDTTNATVAGLVVQLKAANDTVNPPAVA